MAIVLGLGRWPWLFSISALVKASPGWASSISRCSVGGEIWVSRSRSAAGRTVVSFLVAPHLWSEWLGAIAGRADMVGNSIVPVPYWVRALTGLGLAWLPESLGNAVADSCWSAR